MYELVFLLLFIELSNHLSVLLHLAGFHFKTNKKRNSLAAFLLIQSFFYQI